MSEPSEMSTPVTRGELRAEITAQDQRFDHKLENWAGALLARMDALFTSSEQRLTHLVTSQGRELHDDLARHVRALEESMRTMVSVVDDKYADLPRRVTALERKNGAPPSPRKRRRRAS